MTAPRKKPGWAFWTIVVLVVLPVLYVLSSGPTLMIARTRVYNASPSGPAAPGIPIGLDVDVVVDTVDDWWSAVYSPLEAAADHPWGELLTWYWDLF